MGSEKEDRSLGIAQRPDRHPTENLWNDNDSSMTAEHTRSLESLKVFPTFLQGILGKITRSMYAKLREMYSQKPIIM